MKDPRHERRIDAAMIETYHGAARLDQRPTRLIKMVRKHGVVEKAHQLLVASDIRGMLDDLLLGPPDLTVEQQVLQLEVEPLSNEDCLVGARDGLGT